jgi:hypothetical protein
VVENCPLRVLAYPFFRVQVPSAPLKNPLGNQGVLSFVGPRGADAGHGCQPTSSTGDLEDGVLVRE